MNISHCKLSKKTQYKLLEFFVLEVTARSAADMLGIQGKLDKLMDLLLDGAVSKQEHDLKRQKFKSRQIELANQLNSYHMADDGFRDAVTDMLELDRKVHELFISSNNSGKGDFWGLCFQTSP